MTGFVEIRETEDGSGARVSGEAVPLEARIAESTAALAKMAADLRTKCEENTAAAAAHVASGASGAVPGAAPQSASAEAKRAAFQAKCEAAAAENPVAPPTHAGLMARLDALAADEAAAAKRAEKSRSSVDGGAWGKGFFKGPAGGGAPNSTDNYDALRARMDARKDRAAAVEAARKTLDVVAPGSAAPVPASPPAGDGAASAPVPPRPPAVSWKKGFLGGGTKKNVTTAAAAARSERSKKAPTIAARSSAFGTCVGPVREKASPPSVDPSQWTPADTDLKTLLATTIPMPFPGPRFANGAPVHGAPPSATDARPPRAPTAFNRRHPGDEAGDDEEVPMSHFARAREAMRDTGQDPALTYPSYRA